MPAMIASTEPLYHPNDSEIAKTVSTNFTAPMQLMGQLLPRMITRQRGHLIIINLTSAPSQGVFVGRT